MTTPGYGVWTPRRDPLVENAFPAFSTATSLRRGPLHKPQPRTLPNPHHSLSLSHQQLRAQQWSARPAPPNTSPPPSPPPPRSATASPTPAPPPSHRPPPPHPLPPEPSPQPPPAPASARASSSERPPRIPTPRTAPRARPARRGSTRGGGSVSGVLLRGMVSLTVLCVRGFGEDWKRGGGLFVCVCVCVCV